MIRTDIRLFDLRPRLSVALSHFGNILLRWFSTHFPCVQDLSILPTGPLATIACDQGTDVILSYSEGVTEMLVRPGDSVRGSHF